MGTIVATAIDTAPSQDTLLLLAAGCTALAVGTLLAAIIRMCDRNVPSQVDSWEFDGARRIRLRAGSFVFRFLEPLVDDLASFTPFLRMVPIQRIERNLSAGADDLPWTAEEFAATKAIEGLLAAIAVTYIASSYCSPRTTVMLAFGVAVGYPFWTFGQLNKMANTRLDAIRRRLPYSVDLMALMMEAGGGFRESLQAVAVENCDHPLGQEFGKVHRSMERGQTLREALIDLRDRLNQDDVSEMVFSVLKAQELGTPLGQIFLTLAEQMRLRRFQWAEKKAGEAETKMNGPTMLLMMACLLVSVGPLILQAISGRLP